MPPPRRRRYGREKERMGVARSVPDYTKVLRPGTTDTAVLGVDFSEGRRIPSFPELAPSLPAGLTVLECEPTAVEDLPDDRLWPAEYARRVVSEATASGHRIQAVLARCGGAGLACRVAEELASTGTPPAVVLFDPEVVDAGHVRTQFERAVRALEDGVPAETVAEALSRGEELTRRHHGDLAELLAELRLTYAPLVPVALARWNIPVEFGGELVERFTVYTRYLLCAGRAPAKVPDVGVHEVLSRDHPRFPVDGGHPVTRLDVPRTELLRTPEAARVTAEFVRSARTTVPPP
jgi:hypothetical protein